MIILFFLLLIMQVIYHNTYLAYIFNLVGKSWVKFEKFSLLNQVILNIKIIFSYSTAKKKMAFTFNIKYS